MNAEHVIATVAFVSCIVVLTFITALLAVSMGAICLRWFFF